MHKPSPSVSPHPNPHPSLSASLLHLGCLLVALVLMAGCARQPHLYATPEAAVQEHIRTHTDKDQPTTINIQTMQRVGNDMLVLYSRPNDNFPSNINVLTVYEKQGKWYTNDCCQDGNGRLGDPDPHNLVRFTWNHSVDPSVVFGQTLSPQVSTVEATFDTGDEASDAVDNGWFVISSKHGRNPCRLRIRDKQGTLLGELPIPPTCS